MSRFTLSGLPADMAERVARAACRAFHEHLPLAPEAFAFAGVMQPIGNGGADLVLAIPSDDPAQLVNLAYGLLLRACAVADEQGDAFLAEACGDAIELLDDVMPLPSASQ